MKSVLQTLFSHKHFSWFFPGVAFLFVIVVQNTFEANSIIVSKGVAPLSWGHSFEGMLGETQWRGFLWILLFRVMDIMGWSSDMQLSAYLSMFLLGAYGAFWWALRVWNISRTPLLMLFSLAYACNVFVLGWFLSGELFLASSWLYVFLPLLLSFGGQFLFSGEYRMLAYFAMAFFGASSAFLFPSALVAVFMVLGIFSVFIGKLSDLSWREYAKNIFLFWGVIFVMSASSLFSGYTFLKNTPLSSGGDTGGLSFLQGFLWLGDGYENRFPFFHHFESDVFFILFVIILFLPLGLFLWSWAVAKTEKMQHFFWGGTSILAVLLFLLAQRSVGSAFFQKHAWGIPFETFFPYEFLVLFFPAIMLMISAYALQKQSRIVQSFLLIGIILGGAPFFLGNAHQETYDNNKETWQYRGLTKDSPVVHISDDEMSLRDWVVTHFSHDDRIARLPVASEKSNGYNQEGVKANTINDRWSLFLGVEVLSPEEHFFDTWKYAETWERSQEDPVWLVHLLGTSGFSHILFQKKNSLSDESMLSLQKKWDYLENVNLLEKVFENDSLILWSMDSSWVRPPLRQDDASIVLSPYPRMLAYADKALQETDFSPKACEPLGWGRKSCSLSISSSDSKKILTFATPFSPFWGARLVSDDKSTEGLWHMKSFGFFNGWNIPQTKDATIEMIFYPERFVYAGMAVSLGGLFCAILTVVFMRKKKRK
jgi:hypothetical protein